MHGTARPGPGGPTRLARMTTSPTHRQTRQRVAVAEALAGASEFQTAQQVHDRLATGDARVALATVYRNLQAMADAGEIDSIRTPDGQSAYRSCSGTAHHHHLICRSCGKTIELDLGSFEGLVAGIAQRHGFTAVDHEIELFGLCAACSPVG